MEVQIKVEKESDSDGDVPLPGKDSEQECQVPKTEPVEEHVWEVPIMTASVVKCEYESGSEQDEEAPTKRDMEQDGAANRVELNQQQSEEAANLQPTHQHQDDPLALPKEIRNLCLICHKTFSGSSVLKKHYRQHTGEKPYACNICERRFTHNSSFQRHLVTHTGEKPYECSICQHRFTQESSLRTHLRTHTAEKPFECVICHKHFARRYHLEEHSRVHTADKPYACNMCESRFTRKFNLRKHLRSHLNDIILPPTTKDVAHSPPSSERIPGCIPSGDASEPGVRYRDDADC